MIRRPLTAACLAALLAAQAALALAADTGPTNPNGGTQLPINPQADPQANPSAPPGATGTDPRVQGSDTGRQGGADTDGSRRETTESSGSERDGGRSDGSSKSE